MNGIRNINEIEVNYKILLMMVIPSIVLFGYVVTNTSMISISLLIIEVIICVLFLEYGNVCNDCFIIEDTDDTNDLRDNHESNWPNDDGIIQNWDNEYNEYHEHNEYNIEPILLPRTHVVPYNV